jgi:hypothetical protein
MSSKLLVLAFPAILVLASCDTVKPNGAMSEGLGEAVKYDTAIQTINPEPVYAEGGAQPGANGELGQKAVQRYRADTVKAPKSETTTMGSSGSGGGSGGGR